MYWNPLGPPHRQWNLKRKKQEKKIIESNKVRMGAGDLGPGPKVQKRNGSIVLYDQHPGIEHALFGRETIDGHGMPLKNVSILPHLRDVGEAECASLSKKVVFFHL